MSFSSLLLVLALAQASETQAPPPGEAAAHAEQAQATETHSANPGHGAQAAAPGEHAAPGHGAAQAHPAGGGHDDPSVVLMHHVTDGPWSPLAWAGVPLTLPSKHLAFFVIVTLLVLLVVRRALSSYRDGQPQGMGTMVETLVLFVRDEIAEKNIGHDGVKYTSLLCSFFFFILIAALFGLMPFSATSTGNIAVTMMLATVSFLAQQYAGISKFGVAGHFGNLVPHGLPAWLLPIMIPIEILGMFTKPFALMVRLFANMLAGHMVITTLLLLVPLLAKIATFMGLAMAPVSLGLALFIMLLEVLVAFIQAYIFTLLTAIFMGMYAHPAH